jgi:hypothetical protein
VVTNLVVRAAGVVPARLDLAHVGTPEQQLGLTLGAVLIYMRTGVTARAVADGWSGAAVLARSLSPAVAGRRPPVVGPTTVAAMVRLAGVPEVGAAFEPARAGGAAPARLRGADRAGHVGGLRCHGLHVDVARVAAVRAAAR